jgi:hypothetical protein
LHLLSLTKDSELSLSPLLFSSNHHGPGWITPTTSQLVIIPYIHGDHIEMVIFISLPELNLLFILRDSDFQAENQGWEIKSLDTLM